MSPDVCAMPFLFDCHKESSDPHRAHSVTLAARFETHVAPFLKRSVVLLGEKFYDGKKLANPWLEPYPKPELLSQSIQEAVIKLAELENPDLEEKKPMLSKGLKTLRKLMMGGLSLANAAYLAAISGVRFVFTRTGNLAVDLLIPLRLLTYRNAKTLTSLCVEPECTLPKTHEINIHQDFCISTTK